MKTFCFAAMSALLWVLPAQAQDVLKLAISQRGNWETAASELGQEAGFFRKHGIVLEILYTEGGGQTQQAVISGSMDIGISVGTYGVMGAFSKGAPLRVVGNSTVGANDVYWYVRADSPVRKLSEAAGKTIAYSTAGASTDVIVRGLARTYGVDLRRTATGNAPGTFTQVMSGQIDIGWASPPFGVAAVRAGEIRIVARGNEAPGLDGQSVRVMIANAGTLARRPDAVARYLRAYREALDWMYSDPAALEAYGKWAGIPPDLAREVRDEFYPKANLDPARVVGLETMMADAVAFRFLAAPLRPEQLQQLVQVPAQQ